MIKVAIADDHELFLEGLSSIIKSKENIALTGMAKNGNDMLNILHEKETDIVVLDIEMPEMNGLEATKIIREQFPHVKIIILTMHNEIVFIRKIIKAGVQGYILKNRGKEELIRAIHTVYDGGDYYGEDVAKTLFLSLRLKPEEPETNEIKLTRREREILVLIAHGDTTPIISKKLYIAHSTVETHRKNLFAKTGVRNTGGLVRYAVTNNYI